MSTEFFNDQWRMPNNKNQSLVSNYSMDFDGTSDLIDLGRPSEINLMPGVDAFSISAWFKTSDHGAIYSFGASSSSSNTQIKIAIRSGDFLPEIVLRGTATTIGSTTYNDGDWHNIVLSCTTSVATLYIDGSSVGNPTIGTATITSTANAAIGAINAPTGGLFFNGSIDAVSIFDYAVSTGQVTTLYGSSSIGTGNPMSLSPKPQAYYQLGDQSAYNGANYLVPNNSLQDYVFQTAPTGNSYFTIPSITISSTATISIWVNIQLFTSSNAQVLFGGASSSRISINNELNVVRIVVSNGTSVGLKNTGLLAADFINKWHHIALVQSNGPGTLYIDGVNEGALSGGLLTPTYTNIVATSTGQFINDGLISNGALFNIALPATGTESIASLYNNGSPALDISSYSGLQRWYKLNAQDTFDGTNWTIKDYANSQDGTSVGMTSANLVQSNLQHNSGYSPYAITLDGTGEVFNLDNEILLPDNKTVSFWFKLRVVPSVNTQFAIPLSSSNNRYYPLLSNNVRGDFVVYIQGANVGNASTTIYEPIAADVWYNFIITGDGTTPLLYFNGTQYNFGAYTDRTDVLIGDIGARPNGSFNLDGDMTNVAIWSGTTLSSTEATEVYNQGIPSNLNTFSGTKPTAWWQLGSNSSFNATTSQWTCLDEVGTNNAVSLTNMAEDDITNGGGYSANGLGESTIDIVGDAPYSPANAISENIDILDRTTDVPT